MSSLAWGEERQRRALIEYRPRGGRGKEKLAMGAEERPGTWEGVAQLYCWESDSMRTRDSPLGGQHRGHGDLTKAVSREPEQTHWRGPLESGPIVLGPLSGKLGKSQNLTKGWESSGTS